MSRKDILVDYLEYQAAWRNEKAEEYPEDGRNKRSADGLTEFADYLRGLPDNDEDIAALLMLCATDADHKPLDMSMLGELVSEAISKFRFHDIHETFQDFIGSLSPLALKDRIEFGIEHGFIE